MGLFNRNKKDKNFVWRNLSGKIVCPGDSCPQKKCDDTCPIWLNTMALTLIRLNENGKAIKLYQKALEIAPDFYDAWNNLGGIYGGIGKIQDAYNCYLKAHKLDGSKPNPVYGLILATRDLGKYDECKKYIDLYSKLSGDGREDPYRNELNKLQQNQFKSTKSFEKIKGLDVIKWSSDKSWAILQRVENKMFYFLNCRDESQKLLTTPSGVAVSTSFFSLAERILIDLVKFGPDTMTGQSVIPWHYTLVQNFSKMSHQEVVALLESSFLNESDWTFSIGGPDSLTYFGAEKERIQEISEWLPKCSIMQLTAIYCIGNAFGSINVAYILALLMENYKDFDLQKKFSNVAKMMPNAPAWGQISEIMETFNTFKLYYGIHLNKNGKVIGKTLYKNK